MRRSIHTSGMSRVGSFVQATLGSLGVEERVLEQKVLGSWPEVVGPQIAAATNAERISDGTLFVTCKSSMWSNELSLHKPQIVKRLNAAVGKNIVGDIRFSARGFRRNDSKNRVTRRAEPALDSIPLTPDDLKAVDQVAAACESEDLAVKVKQAMLAGKRMQRLKAKEAEIDG